jgi:hypothetical protein
MFITYTPFLSPNEKLAQITVEYEHHFDNLSTTITNNTTITSLTINLFHRSTLTENSWSHC